jgi:hypothetical protein
MCGRASTAKLGRTYRVESTDELPPTWNVLTNGMLGTGGRIQAIDGGAASLPQRVYRTVLAVGGGIRERFRPPALALAGCP